MTDSGQVVIAQTDARNDANGLAGSAGHGLAELENRPFLNQLSMVLCGTDDPCDTQASRIRLESPPPDQLSDGSALATPYSVVAIPDTSWIAGTAAGSDEVFIVDANQQTLLSRHAVGATPRGITSLTLAGKSSLWTYNAVDNSVSRLGIEEDAALASVQTIALQDPRPKRSNRDGICSSPRAPQPLEPFPARAAMLTDTPTNSSGCSIPQMRCCGLRSNTASPDHAHAWAKGHRPVPLGWDRGRPPRRQ